MQLTISTDQRIINSLLLNASFIDNLGLMHGKMGISICFYHLARQTGNQIYEDYAGELIDEIYEEITANTPVDFENGLAGIGWGIEYLVQNDFIEADTDEVLEEFDNRIFKELIYNTPNDIGLLNGLVGIGTYFLKRIQNKASSDEKITTLTNKQTLIHLIDELDRKTQNIAEIISEPLGPPNNSQIFDLTWNYPTLFWFLGELFEQNILDSKIEKIIKLLIKTFIDEENLPKLYCNRLLLSLALRKLKKTRNEQKTKVKQPSNQIDIELLDRQTIVEQPLNLFRDESYGQIIIKNLLNGINRNSIKSELPNHNSSLRYGYSGIAWIYQQLHHQTGDKHFNEEAKYWGIRKVDSERYDEVLSGTATEGRSGLGILEGVAGMLLNADSLNS